MSDGDSHLDDVRLDQSNRIARRVAHGAYRILHAHRIVGDEAWGIFGLLNGGYRLMTEIEQDWPVPNQQRICLDVDARWQPRTLWVQVDAEGVRHNAKYSIAGGAIGIDVQQAPLQSDDQPARRTSVSRSRVQVGLQPAGSGAGAGAGAGSASPARIVLDRMTTWEDVEDLPFDNAKTRAQSAPASRKTANRTRLSWDAGTHLDFASTLSNFIVLQRSDLALGVPVTFDSIVPALPELAPMRVEQTYLYERDEPLRGDPAKPLTGRYRITEDGQDNAATVFWADEHGIVLAQELIVNGEPHGCESVQYTWLG